MSDTSIVFDPNTQSTQNENSLIPYPVIDPRNEEQLSTEALLDAYTLSGGRLNDTTDHNPLAVFSRTLARIGSEILWYANKIPRSLAVAFLRLANVERSLGQKARVSITFTLTGAVTTTYTIPAGFDIRPDATLFSTDGVDLVFLTLEPLVITPGNSTGTVLAECTKIGSFGNVPANVLTQFTIPYANLDSVRNLTPAFGGSDAETLEQVEKRALSAIRRRDTLIVKSDYEDAAQSFLGGTGRAIALPLVGADGEEYQIGSVHVFGVKGDRTLPTVAECNDIQSRLTELVPLGTSVYFSSAELLPVETRVIAQFYDGYDPNQVFQAMRDAIVDFLNPITYPETDYVSIKDVEFVLRDVLGVRRINSVELNGIGLDVLLTNRKTLPIAISGFFEAYNSAEVIFTYAFGEGDMD